MLKKWNVMSNVRPDPNTVFRHNDRLLYCHFPLEGDKETDTPVLNAAWCRINAVNPSLNSGRTGVKLHLFAYAKIHC